MSTSHSDTEDVFCFSYFPPLIDFVLGPLTYDLCLTGRFKSPWQFDFLESKEWISAKGMVTKTPTISTFSKMPSSRQSYPTIQRHDFGKLEFTATYSRDGKQTPPCMHLKQPPTPSQETTLLEPRFSRSACNAGSLNICKRSP